MKKIKIIISVAVIIITIFAINNFVYALMTTTEYASVLYSDNMGGILSQQNTAMNNAKATYEGLGYTTFKVLEPGELTLTSNLNIANVLLTFSHGDMDSVVFDNIGLITGISRIHNGIYHISINNFDWTGKKLVVFCACNTVGYGSSDGTSIAGRVVTQGAQTSVGWYDEISSIVSPTWLNYFNSKLADGYNPLVAVTYANNAESYTFFTEIRHTLVSYTSLSPLSGNTTYMCTNPNSIMNQISYNGELKSSNIESILHEYDKSFKIDDYEISYSDGIDLFDASNDTITKYTSYIDYNLKIGKYVTNSGYTIVIDKDKKVLDIIDNTKQFDYKSVEEVISKDTTEMHTDKTVEDTKYFFDVETNKKYVKYEYKDNSYEIKEIS